MQAKYWGIYILSRYIPWGLGTIGGYIRPIPKDVV